MLVWTPVLHVSGVPQPITCMESVSSQRHCPFRESAEEGVTVGFRSAKGWNAFKDCGEALCWLLLSDRRLYCSLIEFKVDRLQIIVVAKKYIYVSQLFISRMPKMRAIPQLVSAPLNPIRIAEHFRRSHPPCEHSRGQHIYNKAQNNGQQVAGHDDRPNIF